MLFRNRFIFLVGNKLKQEKNGILLPNVMYFISFYKSPRLNYKNLSNFILYFKKVHKCFGFCDLYYGSR